MQRRKKGDGTFTKLENGKFTYRVDYGVDSITGKRIRKSFSGSSENECRKRAKQFEKNLDKEKTALQIRTLGGWLQEWLETYKRHSVTFATYIDYENNANLILKDKISKMNLIDIKPIHIQQFYNSHNDYSQSVLKKMRYLLNGSFESAIDNDLCYKNPVKRIPVPIKMKKEHEIFTEAEVNTIINFIPLHSFGVAIAILIFTGIRSGELRALKWKDIDFNNKTITIDKAITRTQEIGPTKNKKSRIVPLTNELYDILIKRKKQQKYYIIGEKNFLSKDKYESQYKIFFKELNKYCTKNKIETVKYHSPHTMRHTYASVLVKNNINMKIIQLLLGHSEIEMSSHYSHANDNTLKEAVKNIKFTD